MIQTAIASIVEGKSLTREQSSEVMEQILRGDATQAQIAGYAVALRMKGESPDEIAGMAEAMRRRGAPIRTRRNPLLDTCGTGGDNAHTFNISTTTAIVTAACGVAVAKHGNRAVSSRTGSADVLESLGVRIALDGRAVSQAIVGATQRPRREDDRTSVSSTSSTISCTGTVSTGCGLISRNACVPSSISAATAS